MDMSLDDQAELWRAASVGHSMSREASLEASRKGRERAAQPIRSAKQRQDQKEKDEENILGRGKRMKRARARDIS